MGQLKAGAITAETQTRWRLLHWIIPKMAQSICIYTSTLVRVLFFYICVYIIYILYAALLCGTLVRKEELHLRYFPESQSKRPPIYCRKGRGGQKKASCPALGMHATRSLSGCAGQPSPVIDSSVPLGSNTGICWPWNITCWVAPNRAPILPLPEIEGKRKKNPNHNASFCESPCLKSSEEAYNTRAPNAQTRIRCGLMADSAKRG